MIYICYGVTKSASTFLYQITEEILCLSGKGFSRIDRKGNRKLENYYDNITGALLDRVEAAANGRNVVLKTHGPLYPEVAARIAAGTVLASASIRDPREMAMSMADNGARARAIGQPAFAEIVTPQDAFASIDYQVGLFQAWAAVPHVEVFTYNQICFETAASVARVAAQIGVAAEPARVMSAFKSKGLIGQFNVGKPQRYQDMDLDIQRQFLERYAALYARFELDSVPEAMRGAVPGQRLGRRRNIYVHHMDNARRFLRRMVNARGIGVIEPE